VTFDGRTVELFNQPGQFGLQRLFEAAQRKRKDGGVFELRWTAHNVSVAVDLKIVSSPQSNGGGQSQAQGFRGLRLPPAIVGRHDVQNAAPALASAGAQ
jgi:type VI secretion system protein ImpL